MEKTVTEAKLRLLQAQIEPHFLFNTLSNILNLFDTDVDTGKSMQKDLIHYLESSLDKFRKDFTAIEDEIELVKAYLNIFKVRMGSRLKYAIHVPDDLKHILIPPMMIQPLVENAIKHGIEPKIEGGEINIAVEKIGNSLKICVSDTGNGPGDSSKPGIGLSNIRERLELLYGDKAHFMLNENSPTGLNAIIEVPYEKKQSRHRG
jgi:LytS/YehU family sensor histidine kinase